MTSDSFLYRKDEDDDTMTPSATRDAISCSTGLVQRSPRWQSLESCQVSSGDGRGQKPPMRFVFLHRGNGLWPKVLVPPSFDGELQKPRRSVRRSAYEVDLDGHELPEVDECRSRRTVNELTILQGLSGQDVHDGASLLVLFARSLQGERAA